MDGTLVDTEPYWIASEHQLVTTHGNGLWTDDHAHALVGFDLRDAARYISLHGEVALPVDDIVNLLLDSVIERVAQFIPWRPGARELLADLHAQGVPCALVTMSWRRFAEAVVQALPRDSFQTIVTGDDVIEGKPHPEPYLTAALRLNVSPARCVAIEDSPTGVRSAVAAGCMTIGIPHVVDIPADLGHHHLASLDGMTTVGLDLFVGV
jgi:HAD superfamily hydrolase (TIGR01509 family)